jgi:hypothetical protein
MIMLFRALPQGAVRRLRVKQRESFRDFID